MTATAFATPAAEVNLDRVFDAPPAKVFEAWSRPELWSRWFPPRGYTMAIEHMDFRVGGGFKASFHQTETGFAHAFYGTYTAIEPGAKLEWVGGFPGEPEDQMLTTVAFTARDGKTEVRVRQAFRVMSPNTEMAVQGAPIGWGQTLDKLGEFLADPTAELA